MPRRVELPRALPSLTGSYPVGRQAFELVDSSRRDPVDSARARVVVGWIWYPAGGAAKASATEGLERALPGEWGDLRAAASAAKIGDAAAEPMRIIRVHAATGAPWAPSVARAPVVVFTPGNGWLATDYSVLLEDLASHGYVVIGVTPVGLADVVRLRDGRTIRKTLGVGAFGHSLGGTTALVAAATDTLVRAAVNLDGDAMGSVTEVRPRQPLLFVSSGVPTMEEAPPPPGPKWTELARQGLERSEHRRTGEWSNISSHTSSATRVRLLGARHLNFTDAALVSAIIEGPQRRWMRWGPIAGERGLRITADLVRAFFDHTLLGRPADTLLVHPELRYAELRLVPPESVNSR